MVDIGLNYQKFDVSEDIIDIGTGSSKFLKVLGQATADNLYDHDP